MSNPITSYVEQRFKFGTDDPKWPEPGVIQVFYEGDVPTMVDFRCPCGCGGVCPTHLVPPGQPKKSNDRHWEFSRGPNGITLTPSIRFTTGCKAHFNITDGKVVIHGDSGK